MVDEVPVYRVVVSVVLSYKVIQISLVKEFIAVNSVEVVSKPRKVPAEKRVKIKRFLVIMFFFIAYHLLPVSIKWVSQSM